MVRVDSFCCLLLIFTVQLLTTNARQELLPNYPREQIEGVTFESLQDVFQTYPVDRYHTDQTGKLLSTCDGLSGHRETFHAPSMVPVGDTSNYVSKPCYSYLQNCRYDKSMQNKTRFCSSDEKHRRYDYMVTEKGDTYGHHSMDEEECPSEKSRIYHPHTYNIFYPCVCDCESSQRESDRYFSLREAVADPGKVVTGIRFKKVDHVFYIQIQQGKLGKNRAIDGEVEWKDVNSVAKSDLLSSNVSEYYKEGGNNDNLLRFHKNDLVYAVTSKQYTTLLDDLEVGHHEVLTGLRFRQVGKDLRFEIQATPFYRKTGKFHKVASRWVYNDDEKDKRKKVELQNPNVPGKSEVMNVSSSGHKFIEFQVSDFKKDLGQTTVPFIDMTEVVPEKPGPLFGAGIFHRGSIDSAGFIALKGMLYK